MTPAKNQLASLDVKMSTALTAATSSASNAFALATTTQANIAQSLEAAGAIQNLRDMFDDPGIRSRVVALQGTKLGFRTDKDKDGRPYDYTIVKDCVIEGLVRGLQLVGNQINIIAGNFYCTMEGFQFLITTAQGVSEFLLDLGVPSSKTGGVIVPCAAQWKKGGMTFQMSADIPVKTDNFSSVDQMLGKATRKMLSRCYKRMTGFHIEANDDDALLLEGTKTAGDEDRHAALERMVGSEPRVISTAGPTVNPATAAAAMPPITAPGQQSRTTARSKTPAATVTPPANPPAPPVSAPVEPPKTVPTTPPVTPVPPATTAAAKPPTGELFAAPAVDIIDTTTTDPHEVLLRALARSRCDLKAFVLAIADDDVLGDLTPGQIKEVHDIPAEVIKRYYSPRLGTWQGLVEAIEYALNKYSATK